MWTSSLRITWELMRNRKSQVSPQTSTPGKRTVTYDSINLGHLGIEICWVYKQLKKEVCDNYFSIAVIKKIKAIYGRNLFWLTAPKRQECIMVEAWQPTAGTEGEQKDERSHLSHKHEADRVYWKWGGAIYTLKSHPQ